MFGHLRTRLTVLYGGLFAAVLLLISLTVYSAISDNAQREVRRELTTSGAVFDRVWDLRTGQLENDAALLSRDFGFRGAVASNDAPTIRTALDNLKARLGIDMALMIGVDGRVISAGDRLAALDPATVVALRADDVTSGVMVVGGEPYEAVTVPVRAPTDMGWVVFATKLDDRQMRSLEALAAVPLNARVLYRAGSGAWTDGAQRSPASAFIERTLATRRSGPGDVTSRTGAAMTLVKPLSMIDSRQPVVLLLQYPISRALAPYRVLFAILIAAGVLGMGAVLYGTWILARNVTRPISALEDAARRLQRGERVRVAVDTRDEIGRLAETFNSMADEITQRERENREAAAALELARDRAESANRAKSSFLANMSHEVRTPLNGVLGVAGVLARTSLTTSQRQMLDIMESSAFVLQRVLNDVLDLARVEAGRLDIVAEAFRLEDAVRALAASAQLQCQAKGLAFSLSMDQASGASVVDGDRARLEQILGNLISNAVKFTHTGEVSLSVAADGADAWRFEVRDSGIGFDADVAAALFQPFKQADDSITRRYGGSGLGLSISRQLARAMGGDLTAHGEPGKGAAFALVLPLPTKAGAPARLADAAPESAQAAGRGAAPVRILLADDHETNRQVVDLILGALGVDLVSVENGVQAVDAFKTDRFDLVLMDMQMPVMDGLTAIRAIRAHEAAVGARRTPILVVSANAMPEHIQGSTAAGADGHVAKPVTAPTLIAAVEAALEPNAAPIAESA